MNREDDVAPRLRRLTELAADVGVQHVLAEAASLDERMTKGRFFVASVGQFKRGKSTLLNALIGHPVLPTGVVPVTSIVTVVRYGPRLNARLRRMGGPWQEIDPATLAAYVSEEENPQNRKGVDGVEVFSPNTLLASGLCLVDTPGIGSVFFANTKLTRDFIPHVDVALVVLGADPPISGEEMTLVEEVASQTDQLVFVLNKADRLSDRERKEARVFAERILGERLRRPIGPIFEVSATERLSGQPTRDWRALETELDRLARDSGAHLVRAAAERGIARLADRLRHAVDERRDALVRPLEDFERRVVALRRSVVEAERALKDLGPLFTAEQDQLATALEREKSVFLARALPEAVSQLDRALADRNGGAGRFRMRLMEYARGIARRLVEQWLQDVEPRAEALYRRATDRFIELANGFLAHLRTSGDPTFAWLPAELPYETHFRVKRRFYFTDLLSQASRDPLRWVGDLVRPRRWLVAATQRDVQEYVESLLETNSARVFNDLRERVLESRRSLESEIVTLLREISASAEQALAEAHERHAEGAEAVRAAINRLESLRGRVEALRL